MNFSQPKQCSTLGWNCHTETIEAFLKTFGISEIAVCAVRPSPTMSYVRRIWLARRSVCLSVGRSDCLLSVCRRRHCRSAHNYRTSPTPPTPPTTTDLMQGLPAWRPRPGPAGERQLWRISELSALMIYIAGFEAGKKRRERLA